jgi:hypothetical protein
LYGAELAVGLAVSLISDIGRILVILLLVLLLDVSKQLIQLKERVAFVSFLSTSTSSATGLKLSPIQK